MGSLNNMCFWTRSRFFVFLLTLSSLVLALLQYLHYDRPIYPLPLVGLVFNSVFTLVILLGLAMLIKFYIFLLIVYAMTLMGYVIASPASAGLIHYHVFVQVAHSVRALLLVGLSWLLVGGQIIGCMLYLKDLSDRTIYTSILGRPNETMQTPSHQIGRSPGRSRAKHHRYSPGGFTSPMVFPTTPITRNKQPKQPLTPTPDAYQHPLRVSQL